MCDIQSHIISPCDTAHFLRHHICTLHISEKWKKKKNCIVFKKKKKKRKKKPLSRGVGVIDELGGGGRKNVPRLFYSFLVAFVIIPVVAVVIMVPFFVASIFFFVTAAIFVTFTLALANIHLHPVFKLFPAFRYRWGCLGGSNGLYMLRRATDVPSSSIRLDLINLVSKQK